MRIAILTLAMSAMLMACASAGSEAYNPLDDYRQVDAATDLDMPSVASIPAQRAKTSHGEYLVELLGCGSCHTDGALLGKPDMRRAMAGSRVGIAYTSPFQNDRPAIVFPRNLTPDPETGLGNWSDAQIAAAIQTGAGQHGSQRILVMPWQRYARLTKSDIDSVVAYLSSLEPIKHQVPSRVREGSSTREAYVHFGVYTSREP